MGSDCFSIHCCADHETIETVFRTIVSVSQLSLDGAVADMCEEYESCHNNTGETRCGRRISSLVCEQEVFRLQSNRERIEKLSQQDRLSKFCVLMDSMS